MAADNLAYPDELIAGILRSVKTIAMVGASTNWNRPSFFVMKYLQGKGYRVIPVNPDAAGQTLLGETVRARLADIGEPVDMVDLFRRSDPWSTKPSPSARKSSGCSSACGTMRPPLRLKPPG